RADQLYGEAAELVHLGLAETVDGVVIELHPALLITGKIVIAGAADPRPCEQGYVRLQDRSDKRNSRSGRTLTDGEVEIRSVLPGKYQVEVDCDGMVSEPEYPDLELTDVGVSGLVWQVREGLAIRGEVIDAQGAPVEGVQVFASMKTDADDPRRQMPRMISDPTLADGRFTAAGLLPGSYEVRPFGRSDDGDPVIVELEPGVDVDGVRLELPGEGTVVGIVRDAEGRGLPGIGLLANSLDRPSRSVGMSDDQGRFVIEHVPPGKVRITTVDGGARLRAPGTSDDDEQGEVVQVELGETAEIELVVESRNATIHGRVLDEHGSPIADAFVSHQRMSDSAAAARGRGKTGLRRRFED